MGFWTGGKPVDSVIREREKVARGFAGFFRKTLAEPYKAPDVSTERGAGFKARPEFWHYPRRKDGTRREGEYFRAVPRDGKGRFANRFDAKEFMKSHPLLFKDKTRPRHR